MKDEVKIDNFTTERNKNFPQADEKLAEKGYHYAVVSNYLMFYTFNEAVGEVRLMRFLYGGQNIVSML